jgi:SAM-dependent methyltransferase
MTANPTAPPTFLDGLRRVTPWPVRRFLRSFAEDLSSVPRRLRDPAVRNDPWHLVHNVGGGGYLQRGLVNLEIVERQGPVQPNEQILDIGCGHGALAAALLDRLGADGGYVGFDVARAGIRYAQHRFASIRPDFRFVHAAVRNPEYGMRDGGAGKDYRFPAADATFTRAAALSLFTHLSAEDGAAYMLEAGRCLRPEGLLIATFYLLDDGSRAAIAAGRARRLFVHPALGGFTNNPERPEAGIAFDRSLVLGWLNAAGLELAQITEGDWRAPTLGLGGQDILVARRAG